MASSLIWPFQRRATGESKPLPNTLTQRPTSLSGQAFGGVARCGYFRLDLLLLLAHGLNCLLDFIRWIGQEAHFYQRSQQQGEGESLPLPWVARLCLKSHKGCWASWANRAKLSAGSDGQAVAAPFQGLLVTGKGLFRVAGMGGCNHQGVLATCPGWQVVIAMDEDRELDRRRCNRRPVNLHQ